ncbi:MAG TPA: acyl-CoA dehydrogenase family protein [Usitatibacter sp.]|nr:acyl-CoA dehydrogenase family protein [Usitatibacter sp.]
MKFDYSEEQRLVADSVRRFVAQDYGFEARKAIVASKDGWSRDIWGKLAGIGLLGLPFPAELGGFGGRAVDLMSVMEAMGEALVVEPYLSTVGLAGRLVARGAGDALRQEIVAAIVEGRMVMAFAHVEDGARYDLAHVATRATREGGGYRIVGGKRVVLHAPCADRLVVSARASGDVGDARGVSLFLVDAKSQGVSMAPYRTLDEMRAADVRFDSVLVPAQARIGEEGGGLALVEEAADYATALLCAEAVGAMKSACDATLDYLKTRKQFGMPIGAFQALQHRMVDMVIEYEQARSMASLACARVDTGDAPHERARIVSAAKIKTADACRHVSQESVQLHGGMGMTEELKVSHTFRRLTMIASQLGDADHHLERFARNSPSPLGEGRGERHAR